jgi:transcriptional regulator with XRE-family HTH domain
MMPDILSSSGDLGARLREVRAKTGLNQSDFGKLGDVSRTSQAEYEQGKTPPNSDYLALLHRNGVDVRYVLTGIPSTDSLTEAESAVVTKLRLVAPGWMDVVLALLEQAHHPFGPSGHVAGVPEQERGEAGAEDHTLHDRSPRFRATG